MRYKSLILFVLLVLIPTVASAMDFSVHGYYRFRHEMSNDIDTQKKNDSLTYPNDRFGLIQFSQMRLRLDPNLKLNDNISLHAQMDILDNILFGTKNTDELSVYNPIVGEVAMPAGAGSRSLVGPAAGENGSLNVRRVWLDLLTPVGKLRIGRQPSHWGLGIFSNDGNGLQGDFGDTADRVLYIARYEFSRDNAVNFGLVGDVGFEAQQDPSIDGLTTTINRFSRDSMQYAGFLMYDNPIVNLGFFGGIRRRNGEEGTTTTTAFGLPSATNLDVDGDGLGDDPYAAGKDGDTMLYFLDGYARFEYREYRFQIEGVYLFGDISTGVAIDAIPFDGLSAGTNNGIIEFVEEQDVSAFLIASEIDAIYDWGGEWKLMSGFAQGDSNPLSSKITEFGFRPDYDIALMMFDVPLGTSPTLRQNGTIRAGGVPITGNYVNNAMYVAAGYKHKFDITHAIKECNEFKVGARFVTAWAHKNLLDLDFDALINPNTDDGLPVFQSTKKWYGWELDLILEGTFFDHLYGALEGGLLFPGGAYDIANTPYSPRNTANINAIPADPANVAYMGRLTLMVEF